MKRKLNVARMRKHQDRDVPMTFTAKYPRLEVITQEELNAKYQESLVPWQKRVLRVNPDALFDVSVEDDYPSGSIVIRSWVRP